MSGLAATSGYAAALALLYVALSARVILYRRGHGISLGSGGDPVFERRIRAHGNFAEYAPLGLLLVALLEAGSAGTWLVHLLGLMLLAGRTAHAGALSSPRPNFALRGAGMALTLAMLILAAVALLALALT